MLDVLIRGGRVIDGAGNPWFEADVGIAGDRIVAVGRLSGESAAPGDRRRRAGRLPRVRRHAHTLRPPAAREPEPRGEGAPGRHARGAGPGRPLVRPEHGRGARPAPRAARRLERRSLGVRLELAHRRRVPRPARRGDRRQRRIPRAARDAPHDRDGARGPRSHGGGACAHEATARRGARAGGGRPLGRSDLHARACTPTTTSSSSSAASSASTAASTARTIATTASTRSRPTRPASRSCAAPVSRCTWPTPTSATR